MAPRSSSSRRTVPKEGVRWGVIRADIRNFVTRLPGLFRNDYTAIMLAFDVLGHFADHGKLRFDEDPSVPLIPETPEQATDNDING